MILNKRSILCLMLLTMLWSGSLWSQSKDKPIDNTIKGQFKTLIDKSNNYQVYKVVDKKKLIKLNANVIDSINAQVKWLRTANTKLDAQQKEINSLLSDLEKSNKNLIEVTNEKNKMSLLGVSMDKKVYNGLLWAIIMSLMGALTFFILQFKRGHVTHGRTKKALAKNQDEFDLFRKRTLEKEQLLKRRLQDELNRKQGL